jgi:molecular chaperone DnaJ
MALSPEDIARILGIPVDADHATATRAYRRIAAQYHPDHHSGDEAARARFAEVNEAYAAFCAARPASASSPAVDGAPPSPFTPEVINDILAGVFGGAFGNPHHRGSDRVQPLRVSPADAAAGTQRVVELTRRIRCESCRGTGGVDGALQSCQMCDGKRVTVKTVGFLDVKSLCHACDGRGMIPVTRCTACDASGLRATAERVTVTIPPGVQSGQMLRLTGKGDAAPFGAAGDLYLELIVDPALARLARQGDDTVLEVTVGARLWLLGGTIEVPTLDGVAPVRVPRGVPDGHMVRLAGLGHARAAAGPYRADARGDGTRGDQVVILRVPPSTPTRARASVATAALAAAGTVAALLWF